MYLKIKLITWNKTKDGFFTYKKVKATKKDCETKETEKYIWIQISLCLLLHIYILLCQFYYAPFYIRIVKIKIFHFLRAEFFQYAVYRDLQKSCYVLFCKLQTPAVT